MLRTIFCLGLFLVYLCIILTGVCTLLAIAVAPLLGYRRVWANATSVYAAHCV